MSKKQLIEDVLSEFKSEEMNAYPEYAEFCESMLEEMIPFLSVEGLKKLQNEIRKVTR